MKIALAAVLLLASSADAATPSDLRDYALASCLIKQAASPALREEGYRLADLVIARAGIDPFRWRPVQAAVEATLAMRGLLTVHVDGPVAQATRPAPLASCLQVIDAPSVRRAMTIMTRPRRH